MADADADAAAPAPAPAPAPDPTLEADLRTTAALRAVLEAREADEITRLVQELKRRPILEDAIFVKVEQYNNNRFATIPRSKAPWFFGLLDHYDWAVAEHHAPPTYPGTPFLTIDYFAPWTNYGGRRYEGTFAQPDGSGGPDDGDDAKFWPFEVLFGRYEQKERLALCEKVLGVYDNTGGIRSGPYQVHAYWRLRNKVEKMFTSDIDKFRLSEEEAANREKFKVVAMVKVRHVN